MASKLTLAPKRLGGTLARFCDTILACARSGATMPDVREPIKIADHQDPGFVPPCLQATSAFATPEDGTYRFEHLLEHSWPHRWPNADSGDRTVPDPSSWLSKCPALPTR